MIIKGLEFNSEDIEKYYLHLWNRLHHKDKRQIEEREKERTILHNKILDSFPIDNRTNAQFILEDYIENRLGCSTILIGYSEVGEMFS